MTLRPEHRSLWRRIQPSLEDMDAQTLRALIADLFSLAPENRAFLASWVGDEEAGLELRAGYRRKIEAQFYGPTGKPRYDGRIDYALCRRLIKEYGKATSAPEEIGGFDVGGVLDLSLAYLEVATRYSNDLGMDDARHYDSLCRVVDEVTALAAKPAAMKWARTYLHRIVALTEAADGIGHGYGDFVAEMASEVQRIVSDWEKRRPRMKMT